MTAITTTSSSGRTANRGKAARSAAQALAEAGLANGLVDPGQAGRRTRTPGAVPEHVATAITTRWRRHRQALGGLQHDDLNGLDAVREGLASEPDGGGAPITKTLSRTSQVLGIAAGATVQEWSRFIYDDAEYLLHDRHRHDPRGRCFPGADVPQERRQRRRELDRRCDHGRRRGEPHCRGAERRERRAHRTHRPTATSSTPPGGRMRSSTFWRRPTPTGRRYTIPAERVRATISTRRDVLQPSGTIFRPLRSFAGFRSRSSGTRDQHQRQRRGCAPAQGGRHR